MAQSKLLIAGISLVVVVVIVLGAFTTYFASARQKDQTGIKENTDAVKQLQDQSVEDKQTLEQLRLGLRSLEKASTEQLLQLRRQNVKLQNQLTQLKQQSEQLANSDDLKWHTNRQTGHSYTLTPYPLPWHHAAEFAKDHGGHLVVIEDVNENTWLTETFGGRTQYWIGLSDEAVEGDFYWVNNQKAEYFNWLPGEPDNFKKKQNHIVINPETLDKEGKFVGRWNDISGNLPKIAIIERQN